MPTLYDRSTGDRIGEISDAELRELLDLMDPELRSEEPGPIDPDVLTRLAESGGSPRVLALVDQMARGRDDFDLGWER